MCFVLLLQRVSNGVNGRINDNSKRLSWQKVLNLQICSHSSLTHTQMKEDSTKTHDHKTAKIETPPTMLAWLQDRTLIERISAKKWGKQISTWDTSCRDNCFISMMLFLQLIQGTPSAPRSLVLHGEIETSARQGILQMPCEGLPGWNQEKIEQKVVLWTSKNDDNGYIWLTYIHTCIHTYVRTYIHTYIH